MNKSIAVLLTIFLIFPYVVYSASTFVIQETEKISLRPTVSDPDADKLTTFYSAPLDEKGEWQTTYGDAGEYKTTITVSDGFTNVSKEVLIIVNKKEQPPEIDSFSPEEYALSIKEAESVKFSVSASDPNKDKLSYQWFLDGKYVKEDKEFSYDTTYKDYGAHKISVIVSDGEANVSKEWSVDVANVDVESLLDQIKDVTVNEGEVAKLELPDFETYGLTYSISEPIGNKNEWNTTYNDAGSYKINIHAEGKGFSGYKTVELTVKDFNRAPVLEKIKDIKANEGDNIVILLNANDPDGDAITYSVENPPAGSSVQGNSFFWTPTYDTASNKETKKFNLVFVASDGKSETKQIVNAEISNKNRPPRIINATNGVVAKVNEPVLMFVNAVDDDNNKLTYTWQFGFFEKYKATSFHQRIFSSTGTKLVKVVVSDGTDKIEHTIIVTVVAPAIPKEKGTVQSSAVRKCEESVKQSPYIRVTSAEHCPETSNLVETSADDLSRELASGRLQYIKVNEGEKVTIVLNQYDSSGNRISYAVENPPAGSSLINNVFSWTPSFSFVDLGQIRRLDLVFIGDNGITQTRYLARLEVADNS